MKFKILVLAILAFSLLVPAASTINAPAVDSTGIGILTPVTASVAPGSGRIRTDIQGSLIATETEESIRIAALVASQEAEVDLQAFDVNIDINSDAQLIDGPSGGLAFALSIYNEFLHIQNPDALQLRSDMAVTGAITPDGRIERVGGVEEKIVAAHENGIKLMLIAAGQSASDAFDYVVFAREISQGSLQVVEVRTLQQAIQFSYSQGGASVEAPEFAIQPLVLVPFQASEKTLHIRQIALEEVEKARLELEKLRQSNGNDPQINAVIRSLNETLKNSQEAINKGYYYTGANAAFLANINLLTINSEEMTMQELQQRIEQLESEITTFNSTKTTTNNFEAVAAAKLRYWWARTRLAEVKEAFNNANTPSPGMVRDYYNTLSWFEAAKKLMEHASTLQGGGEINEFHAREYALDLIYLSEEIANGSQDSEVQWHLATAKQAFSNADYVASAFDLQFVISAHTTDQLVTGKTGQQIIDEFSAIDPNNAYAGDNSHWAELYYANSLYSLQEAERTGEIAGIITSVRLKQLAAGFQQAREQLTNEFANPRPPSNRTIQVTDVLPAIDQRPRLVASISPASPGTTQLVALAIIVIGILILIGVALSQLKTRRPTSRRELIKKLDEALVTGRISEGTYKRLKSKYKEKQKKLKPGALTRPG